MKDIREYLSVKLVRDYVVSFLHPTGENHGMLSVSVEGDVRYNHADGFGKIYELDHDLETTTDMIWDWTHVNNSSNRAFEDMATAISKSISDEDKLLNPLLDFSSFCANGRGPYLPDIVHPKDSTRTNKSTICLLQTT
jgi:hypothetical protein